MSRTQAADNRSGWGVNIMKSSLVGLVVFSIVLSFTNLARGEISARANVRIFATDSQLNSLPLIEETDLDFDQLFAGTAFLSIAGGTDIGSATARANGFGTHVGNQRLVGLDVGGSANITRPPSGGWTFFHTGRLSADAQVDVQYSDELLFTFEPSVTDQVRISGFLNLRGNLNFGVTQDGPTISSFASVGVDISGTGLTRAIAGGNSLGLPSLNQTIGDVHLFSFDVSQGAPKPITFRLLATGAAQITGANFVVTPGASAAAGFNAAFANSLDWGGITNVVNARTGEAIANWTVTSRSGFDYSKVFPPVPEPSSLVLVSIVALGWMLRRRRR